MCVCALPALWTYVQEGALSDRDTYRWVMVCSVRVECVSVSSFGEGLAVCGCCCRVLTATAVPSGLLVDYREHVYLSTLTVETSDA